MSSNINVSKRTIWLHLMIKKFRKPQFWHIFVYFYPICSLVDPFYNAKFGLFCFICLHYIILLWVPTKILHNDLFNWISWSKYSEKLHIWHIFAHFCPICGLVDPLYDTKFRLFCFICLEYIILLWVLT